MPAFVTQTVEEQLKLLVLASDVTSELVSEVVNVLQLNQFQVDVLSWAEFNSDTQNEYYKKILIHQLENKKPRPVQDLSAFLALPGQKLVLSSLSTPCQSQSPLFEPWVAQTKVELELLHQAAADTTGTEWCFGLDLAPALSLSVWQQAMFSRVDQQKVFDPDLEIRPQLLSEFAHQISQVLLAPWTGQKWLFQGTKTTTAVIAQQVVHQYQLIHGVELSQKPVVAESQPLPDLSWQVKTNHYSVVSATVDRLIKQLPAPAHVVSENPEPAPAQSELPQPQQSWSNQPVVSDSIAQPAKATTSPPVQAQVEPLSEPTLPQARGPKTATPSTSPLTEIKVPPEHPSDSTEAKPAPSSTPAKKHAEPSLPTDKDISSALQKLFQDQQVEHKVKRVTFVAKETKRFSSKKKKKQVLFYLGLISVGVGLGMLTLFGVFMASVRTLEHQLVVLSQDLDQTQTKTFSEKSTQLSAVSTLVEAQIESYQLVFADSMFAYPRSLLEVSHQLVGVGQLLNESREFTHRAVQQVIGTDSGDVIETLQAANSRADQVYKQLSQLQAAIDSLDQSHLSSDDISTIESFTDMVESERRSLAITQQLQPLLPQLLGLEGKRQYVVLLQDNQELRPTGGFINSVALVTLDQGLLVDTQVFSIYELDQQIAGEISPPAEIQAVLGEDQFYFRDANWDLDLSSSADELLFFVKKSLGVKADGILTLDLYGLEAVIESLGPLELPGYNEVVTHKNIHERAAFHSEVTLVAEAGERNYLTAVFTQAWNQLTLLDETKVGLVLSGFHTSLQNHHAQLYLSDQAEQASIEIFGWSGEITTPACPTLLAESECVVDSFAQVEANIGVNKANHYLERAVDHQVEIRAGQAAHTRTITYQNTAQTKAWPKGPYQAYMRFVLPATARNLEVRVGQNQVPSSQLRTSNFNGRSVIGVLLEVPIAASREVELAFTTDLPATDSGFSYALFDQKQPGTHEDLSTIRFTHSPDLVPTMIAPKADVSGQAITFSSIKNKHQFVGAVFQTQ